jgi:hypothetical protein
MVFPVLHPCPRPAKIPVSGVCFCDYDLVYYKFGGKGSGGAKKSTFAIPISFSLLLPEGTPGNRGEKPPELVCGFFRFRD